VKVNLRSACLDRKGEERKSVTSLVLLHLGGTREIMPFRDLCRKRVR
jgi:hypothetical protein